jgi:PAS domain S-box-containing protein
MGGDMPEGRHERALRIRRALGTFFQAAVVPIVVLDPDARFASANEAAIRQYGYSLEELVAMQVKDLHVQAFDKVPEVIARVMSGEKVQFGRRAHQRRDGSVVWVIPKPSHVNVEGEELVVSLLHDVTDVVAAEEKARTEEQRAAILWAAGVERSGRSFALLDRECRILRSNGPLQQRTRKSAEQLQGMPCSAVFLGRCGRQPCPHRTALVEQRGVVEETETIYGLPMRMEAYPAPPNDIGIAVVHIGEDLTEEHAIRTRLVTADRLASLGRVTAAVAHEVNNPAGFVLLALALIRDRIGQGKLEEALSLIGNAHDAMMQITAIMRDLRGFGRDDPRSIVDLGAVANGALRIAAYEAEARARIERRFEQGVSAEVRGGRVAQVILNLVVNAAQAIPPGDPARHRIEVHVRRSEGQALVEVADTGTGVPEEIGDRIFDPFFTTRAELGGTGLGLWLSRAMVEEEGGTLTWRNGKPAGAVFTVTLPTERTP